MSRSEATSQIRTVPAAPAPAPAALPIEPTTGVRVGPATSRPDVTRSDAKGPVVRVVASPLVDDPRPAPPASGRERGPAADPRDAGPREPDVVHVTIGRVDVRAPAAPPPPAPVRTATGPPDLSLGDYLRGRREAR